MSVSDSFDHSRWHSPLSYRYGSKAMRSLWSEHEKRKTWRWVWVALAEAQAELGLFDMALVDDLRAHQGDIDVAAAEALEAELKHDLVAELRIFATQCQKGGRILHLGATSMDIEDNADVLRVHVALGLLRHTLGALLGKLSDLVEAYADHATMGFTHLQPAEPTTLGYRFAQWAQDLFEDWLTLGEVRDSLRCKGFKGAVGTSASYLELLGDAGQVRELERRVLTKLGIGAFAVSTQTYPRKQDLKVVNALASLGQSLYRMAFDVRFLQSPLIGEVSEPFGDKQVGSSAMPFKRNPIGAENIDSLGRQLAALPRIAWDNAAHCLLERTLDDSANRRSLLPESFLLADAMITRTRQILDGLKVDAAASERLLASYGVFSATERVLMEASRAGGDRQVLHELLRDHAMYAWTVVARGDSNPLPALIAADDRITRWVSGERVPALLDARTHIGDAPERARMLTRMIRETLAAEEKS